MAHVRAKQSWNGTVWFEAMDVLNALSMLEGINPQNRVIKSLNKDLTDLYNKVKDV